MKIDRSFVSRMGIDAKGSEMVRAIIALARQPRHGCRRGRAWRRSSRWSSCRRSDATRAQGFYFSRPVDFAECDGLIASQPWRAAESTALAMKV